RPDNFAAKPNAFLLELLARSNQISESFLFHQPPNSQDQRLLRRDSPKRESLEIQAIVYHANLPLPIEASPNVVCRKAAVRHDKARATHPIAQLWGCKRVVLKNILGMGSDTVGCASQAMHQQGHLGRQVRIMRVQVPNATHLADQATCLQKGGQVPRITG